MQQFTLPLPHESLNLLTNRFKNIILTDKLSCYFLAKKTPGNRPHHWIQLPEVFNLTRAKIQERLCSENGKT
jgi:hypothetical protein